MPRPPLNAILFLGLSWALATAGPAAAQAVGEDYINPDRPGIADGSTTVGRDRLQIETAIQLEFRKNSPEHDRTTLIPTLVRFGIADSWEVRLEGNGYDWFDAHDGAGGAAHASGLAPVSIGLKYALLNAGPGRPSIGAIVRVFPPSGSGDFRTSRATGDLRLAADWAVADQWSLNPNLGVALYEDGSNRSYATGLAAMTLNFNPSKKLNLFVDTGIQSQEEKDGKASIVVDAGGAYIIGRDIQVDLSIGEAVAGSTPPRPFVALGFSERF